MLGQAAHLSIMSEHAGGMTIEKLANTIVAKTQLSDDEIFKALMYHVPANVDHPDWSYTTDSGNTHCSIWLSRDVRSKQPNSCRPKIRICAKNKMAREIIPYKLSETPLTTRARRSTLDIREL